MTDDESHWEDLDAHRMWGVFDTIGYSADPIALFRSREAAEEWLAWDASRGDDRTVCCEWCVCAVDNLEGSVWNHIDDPPKGTP